MRVLVVDDNEINRKLLRVTLTSGGHEVVEASDGAEALERLASNRCDAVISDILMPRMDGYRLCYEIRRDPKLRTLPVIIYSSTYTSPADEHAAMGVGADEFIRKPASPAKILESIATWSHGGASGREPPRIDSKLDVLQEYSERLVQKLEDKNLELEAAKDHLSQAFEAVRESEDLVRLLLDSTAEGIYGIDPEGKFMLVNAAALSMLKYGKSEDLLGEHAHPRIHGRRSDGSAYPPEDCGIVRTLREGQGCHASDEVLWRADGTSFPVEYWSYPLRRDGRVIGAVVTFLDITERQRSEETLRRSEQRFAMAFHASPAPTCITEISSGHILDVNDRFLEVFGFSRGEVIGKTSAELALWASRADRKRLAEAVRAGEDVRDVEVQMRTRSGEIRDVIGSAVRIEIGGLACVLSTFIDVTERKRADEALRASEKRFRNYFDLGLVGMATTSPTKVCLEVNDEICRILGYERDELLTKTWAEMTHPDDLAADNANFARVLAGEIDGYTMDKRWIAGDGRVVDSIISVRCVRAADGSVDQFIALLHDVTDRKRAERESRRNEERFRKLLESNTIGIFIADLSGEILEANDAYLHMLGYVQEEVLAGKLSWGDLTPPEHRDRDQAAVEELRRTGIAQPWEKEYFRKDGTRVPVLIGVAMLDESEGSCIVYIVDLTERKRAEAALRDSEERYRMLFESNPQPLWVFDESTLRLLAVNDAACRHYGYSREEFLALTIKDIRPAADVPALMKEIDDAKRDSLFPEHWRHKKKDGTLIDVEVTSHPLIFDGRSGQLILATDITQRLHAEEALRASEERYRIFFEASPLPGWLHDIETLKILAANQAAVDHYGYTREEFLSMSLTDLRPPEEVNRMPVAVQDTIPRPAAAGVWKHRKKNGALIDMDVHVQDLSLEGRRVRLSLAQDVTEKRSLELQLQQAQKMEAVGQLAGGVAHDFNNVLTAILGYSDLLAMQLGEGNPMQESVDEIRRAGERAASLTRQLLAFSRRQVLEPRVLDPNELIRNVEKMLRRLIGEDLALATRLDPSIGRIRADPGQVEQVLLNLAVNARDAMPRGGTLTIETQNAELDEAYAREHVTVKPGSYVMIAVTDTGTGMDAEVKAHIFEPFFTTKEKGKGTGLGLATVYGIVKQSGGYIWAYSEPGRGTSFKIYLPRVESPAERLSRKEPGQVQGGTETILLVEDEQPVRKLARAILESHGYTVLEADGADQALDVAKNHSGPLELLLTDVVMPKMGGSDLATMVHGQRPGIKVLYMSGYTDDAIVRQGLVGEGAHFLQKPFTPDALASKVRESLDAGESR